jgi:hypothetical protein
MVALAGATPALADEAAQRPPAELEYLADQHDGDETPAEEAAAYDPRPRPWRIDPWVPLNWRSNLALAPRDLRSGLAFEPEATLGRSWSIGPARLITEASAFVSVVPSSATRNSSGWWLTAEVTGGNAAEAFAPYAIYEPLILHDGFFGGHLLTFHTMTAGARRAWGPTNLNLFLRRRASTVAALERTLVAAQLSHTAPLGNGLRFNIRTDAEARRYDRQSSLDGDSRRRDLFLRARARLFIPLSPSADLVLNADVQRTHSSASAFRTTQVVIGPVLSASFGL